MFKHLYMPLSLTMHRDMHEHIIILCMSGQKWMDTMEDLGINDVQHALSCRVGGLPIHRHNDIRDLSASLISEVCTNTEIEPRLQPLTGERLDR